MANCSLVTVLLQVWLTVPEGKELMSCGRKYPLGPGFPMFSAERVKGGLGLADLSGLPACLNGGDMAILGFTVGDPGAPGIPALKEMKGIVPYQGFLVLHMLHHLIKIQQALSVFHV